MPHIVQVLLRGQLEEQLIQVIVRVAVSLHGVDSCFHHFTVLRGAIDIHKQA
ncbi:MAG: hypothetical protein IKH63_09415 [Prevotella sp.]|nr:hypothetical protein [Prevotella sp.]